MRLLISGCGRGGTNLVTEMLRSLNIVNFSSAVEDRSLFNKIIPEKYATKLAIENTCATLENMTEHMFRYKDLHIVLALRNPIDNCMSKIVRGQKMSDGGDSKVEILCGDADPAVAIDIVKLLYTYISTLQNRFSKRVHVVKMEDLIIEPEITIKNICKTFDIKYDPKMLSFSSNNRNAYQQNRYGKALSATQVDVYKQENTFDGFFNDKQELLNTIINAFREEGYWKQYYDL